MDKETIDTYNKIAVEYDNETVNFWDEFPKSFLNEFILLSGSKVLDIGSGPGRDGLLLKDSGKEVLCIDASEEMVRLSSMRGLDSIVGDFMSLPFNDYSYDGVWAYTSLLHTPKNSIDTPLSEIYRVLKPTGVFALGLIEGEGEEYKETTGPGLKRLFSFYSKEEIELLSEKHGFEIIYSEIFKPRERNYLNYILRKI